MRRYLQTGLIFVILLSLIIPAVSQPPSLSAAPLKQPPRGPLAKPANLPQYAPDEILVAFKPGIRPDVAAQAVGARVHSQIEGLGVHILKVPPGTVESTLRALEHNPLVEFAEPNGTVYAFADPDDPHDNTTCYDSTFDGCVMQWGWGNVQAYQGWDLAKGTTGATAVKVAVVDTGVDIAWASGLPDNIPNEDLGAACGNTYTLKSWVSGEPRAIDDHGHGTHVAGIIGACTNNTKGVAGANWGLHFIVEKVLDFTGGGYWSWVAYGIRDAADKGAKVINISLGGPTGSGTLKRAVDYAWRKGAVLVCAAGNEGNTLPGYPAYYTNCLAVAATNSLNQRTSWSTYGSWVEVAAPGEAILSTFQNQCDWAFLCWWYGYGWSELGYESLSGTSMSAPVVSGLAALIWSTNKCATNACVRGVIENLNSVDAVGSFVSKGKVNFLKAINTALALP